MLRQSFLHSLLLFLISASLVGCGTYTPTGLKSNDTPVAVVRAALSSDSCVDVMKHFTDRFIEKQGEGRCSDKAIKEARLERLALSKKCSDHDGNVDTTIARSANYDNVAMNEDAKIVRCASATSTTFFWLVKSGTHLKIDNFAKDNWFERAEDEKRIEKNQKERAEIMRSNQAYCDKEKAGSSVYYGYLSAEYVKDSPLIPNSMLKKFSCECMNDGSSADSCVYNHKCVSRPWKSHCVDRSDRPWMCDAGFYQLGKKCETWASITEACVERFGYGFVFTGITTDDAHECLNIGSKYQKRYLNITQK